MAPRQEAHEVEVAHNTRKVTGNFRLSGRRAGGYGLKLMMLAPWVLLAGLSARGQTVTTDIPGPSTSSPNAVAVNPVTNKIYVANGSNSTPGKTTVINGATILPFTVIDANAINPYAIAVNPVTNMIYVANYSSSNVTVINGATDTVVATIGTPPNPDAVAVNPQTNKIYVASFMEDTVTVIDGSTNTVTATPTTGSSPVALAINPVTNTIYVANKDSSSVTVIDGSTDLVITTVISVNVPVALAVNPVTNKVYVANGADTTEQVISGSTNTITATITDVSAVAPVAIAVNPNTNVIYAANAGDGSSNLGNISIINGSTDTLTTNFADGMANMPQALAINPLTDILYVANATSNNVTVMDADTNTYVTTLTDPDANAPYAVGINPVTNKVYVVNNGSDGTTVIDASTYHPVTPAITAGIGPYAIAANPATNTLYAVNQGGNSVTVITGATDAVTATVSTGTTPYAVAINPVTNQIYVPNFGSNNVTVIDGATNSPSTITDPSAVEPVAVAVNPVTNTIYVANQGTGANGSVTIIDGNTGVATNLVDPDASSPVAVAVNPATDTIYVANHASDNVTVIDGTTNTVTATVAAGVNPIALVVNPVTNMIYVANHGNGSSDRGEITAINGLTNATITITDPSANGPVALGVNPVTNTIFVADELSDTISIINGAANTYYTALAPGQSEPYSVAVDTTTNHIYVANYLGGSVTVIDGSIAIKFEVVSDPAAGEPGAVTVNPATGQVYTANFQTDNVSHFLPQRIETIPIQSAIVPLAGDKTASLAPTFTFSASNALTTAPIDNLLFLLDTWQSPWLAGNNIGPGLFTGVATLQPGYHTLYAYSTEGEEATSVNTGFQSAPLIGGISSYGFLIAVPEAGLLPATMPFPNQAYGTASTPETVTLTNSGTAPLTIAGISIGGANPADFQETDNCASPLAGPGTCTINITFTPSTVTAESATVTVADDSGGIAGKQQTVNLTGTGIQASTGTGVMSSANPSILGNLVNFTATINPPGAGFPTGTITFKDSSTVLCASALIISGLATCPISNLTTGSHSITAVYSGDADFIGSTSLILTQLVNQSPAITSANFTTFTVGTLGSFTATALGFPAATFTENGALPNGVTFNNSTGVLTGIPAAGTGGTYPLTLTALNGTLPNDTQSFTLTVNQPPAISSASSTTFTVGTPGSFTVTASGFPATTLSEIGVLPNGVTFNASTGSLSGSPAANTAGAYTVTFTASNGVLPVASQSFTLTVISASTTTSIASIAPNPSMVGQPVTVNYTVTLQAPAIGTIPGTDSVHVADSTGASCTGTVAAGSCALVPLAVGPDTIVATYIGDANFGTSHASVTTSFSIVPMLGLTGLSPTLSPTMPTSVGLTLNTPTPVQLTGTLTLSFQSAAAGTPPNYIDPGTQFAAGGTTLNFTIPAGSTTPTLAQGGAIQQGTTAGTLIVTLTSLEAGTTPVALPQPNPNISVAVPSLVPTITAGTSTITGLSSSGFNVELDAFTTTHDLANATFTFQAASNTQLNGADPPPVSLASTASTWFSSTSGLQAGGSFHFKVPFSFSGDTSALGSVTVTLSNSVGNSASVTIQFK